MFNLTQLRYFTFRHNLWLLKVRLKASIHCTCRHVSYEASVTKEPAMNAFKSLKMLLKAVAKDTFKTLHAIWAAVFILLGLALYSFALFMAIGLEGPRYALDSLR